MVRSVLFTALLGTCYTASALSLPKLLDLDLHLGGLAPRDTVSNKINAFVGNLSLSSSQVKSLASTYSSNSDLVNYLSNKNFSQTALTTLACYSAQFILGSSAVQQPASTAEADENWSSAVWQTPSCAILPSNEQGVSIAVKIVNFLQIKFATRSGGHSPNPGFAAIGQPGVLIDLQKLKQVTVSADRSTVTLGPGAIWGDVYAQLDPYNIGVIGGRLPSIGVAGLILGGGYFHFSAKYGLAADNVKTFGVILADGTYTNASATQNSDLFWALKGGGPNFGIAVRFDVYSAPVRNIWYNVTVYPNSEISAVFDAMVQWQNNGAVTDTMGTVALIAGLDTVEVGLIYAEPTYKPASFAPFYNLSNGIVAIPPTNGTLSGVTTILGASETPLIERHDYRGASSKINSQLYQDVFNIWQPQASAVYNTTGANQTFVIQPWPSTLAAAGNARGGNPLGLPSESFQSWTTLVDWADASQDQQVRQVSINTANSWQSLSQQRGLSESFLFMNDASREQDPLASYGSANLAKLKTIATKYDPTGFFQKQQNNGFLVSKA